MVIMLIRARESEEQLMAGLRTYVIRRLLFMIPVFLSVSIITFVIMNAAGNPLEIVRFGIRNLTSQQLEALKRFFHLDQPLFVRYFLWLSDFIRGDLGLSLADRVPVINEIGPWILTTLELQILSLLLSLVIGILVGVHSALRQYSLPDVTVTTVAIFGVSMPTVWLGLVFIIIFSLYLGVLPSNGAFSPYPPYWWGNPILDHIAHLILPLSVLTFVSLATIVRLVRANMLEVLRQDYITAARASGVPERRVIYRHALKNAISPVVTIIGLSFGLSLSGAPGLETVFGWPGLGRKFVQAALQLDLPVVQDLTMIITIMALFAILLTDLAYAYLDPRVRLG